MTSDRELEQAAALNTYARGVFAFAERHHSATVERVARIEEEIAEKTDQMIEAHDDFDRLTRIMLDAAEVILKTDAHARQHALVVEAKKTIAEFVAQRCAKRRAA